MKFSVQFLIFSTFLILNTKTDLAEELQRVLDAYYYAPECVFNYTQLDSKTVKFFPICSVVYGIIVINDKTDLAMNQLRELFFHAHYIIGGFRIENSKLKSLSFLPTNQTIQFYSRTYGFFIQNNPLLSDASGLSKIEFISDGFTEITIKIENNTKLDTSELCEDTKDLLNISINGNLKDCDCDGSKLTMQTMDQYKSCTNLYRGLSLTDINIADKISSLSSIEVIKGQINIQNTNLQNLSFLENFREFKFNSGDQVVFNLQNNTQMTRLGISNWTSINNTRFGKWMFGKTQFNIENLHPDFCLTRKEMFLFFNNDVTFINFHTKLCEETEEWYGVCAFKSMVDLPGNCGIVIGDVEIRNGDEKLVSKFLGVHTLYGTLDIRNTNLTDLGDFRNLMVIVNTNDTRPVIQLIGNKNLTNPFIGIVMNIYTRQARFAIIQDNHPNVFISNNGTCDVFGIIPNELVMWRRQLNYVGGDCGESVNVTTSLESSSNYGSSVFGSPITITLFLVLDSF